jgi:hypothetical protein
LFDPRSDGNGEVELPIDDTTAPVRLDDLCNAEDQVRQPSNELAETEDDVAAKARADAAQLLDDPLNAEGCHDRVPSDDSVSDCHALSFSTNQAVPAGDKLFLDYGDERFKNDQAVDALLSEWGYDQSGDLDHSIQSETEEVVEGSTEINGGTQDTEKIVLRTIMASSVVRVAMVISRDSRYS